ncbi:MAG: hypothetical protein NZ774_00975, partial [Candidatus Poseidoniales archaeon]|nr:hypothetical protein [Candidatus Poseidoniales archaeon]
MSGRRTGVGQISVSEQNRGGSPSTRIGGCGTGEAEVGESSDWIFNEEYCLAEEKVRMMLGASINNTRRTAVLLVRLN